MTDTPPVLFVHGIRTSATMWRRQLVALGAAGHKAAAIDLPGHGARLGEEFTIDSALRIIDDGVDALGGPVLLVGLSLGGYLSIEYAAQHPGKVTGLVAASCCTSPRGPALASYRGLAAAIHALPDRGRGLNDFMVRCFVPEPGATDIGAGGVALDVMSSGLREAGTLDPLARLAEYPGPVWLVNGQFDHFRAQERRFLAACANGCLVIVPGATHLVSLVKPNEFTGVVCDALGELSPGSADGSPIVGANG
ncbi:alpha/beta fold hydrolase [Luethyella okanaganae]|uniref:Alpha/beta fold hydrolase n=1 Tax=Luethyella okanaganae TaxID=69372 RepID=A0ABW1VFZ4_9MICO